MSAHTDQGHADEAAANLSPTSCRTADDLTARVSQLEFLVSRGKLSREACSGLLLAHAAQLADYRVAELWADPLASQKWRLIAVRKPFNMLVHAKDYSFAGERNVESWFAEKYPGLQMHACHAMQGDVSGVVILGTSRKASQACRALFEQEQVRKTYHALVAGHPPWPDEVRLDFPVRGGRPATFVRVLRPGWWAPGGLPASLVEAWTMVGRAHQVEQHLRLAGYPILGECQEGRLTSYRLFLHLSRLELPLPAHPTMVRIDAPHDFDEQLGQLNLGLPSSMEADNGECPHAGHFCGGSLRMWGAELPIEVAAEVRRRWQDSGKLAGQPAASVEDMFARLKQYHFLVDGGGMTGDDCIRLVLAYPESLAGYAIKEAWAEGELLVVDKPFNRLLYAKKRLPREVPLSEDFARVLRPGCAVRACHRLDYGTSGALLLATSKEAAHACGDLFATRKVKKVYHAIVLGIPPWSSELCLQDPIQGKEAETVVRVLQRGFWTRAPAPHVAVEAALVEARPTTGRTHQIRVHLAGAGYPVLGDLEYGGCPQGDKAFAFRTFLHSTRIELPLPTGVVAVEACPRSVEQQPWSLLCSQTRGAGRCPML